MKISPHIIRYRVIDRGPNGSFQAPRIVRDGFLTHRDADNFRSDTRHAVQGYHPDKKAT